MAVILQVGKVLTFVDDEKENKKWKRKGTSCTLGGGNFFHSVSPQALKAVPKFVFINTKACQCWLQSEEERTCCHDRVWRHVACSVQSINRLFLFCHVTQHRGFLANTQTKKKHQTLGKYPLWWTCLLLQEHLKMWYHCAPTGRCHYHCVCVAGGFYVFVKKTKHGSGGSKRCVDTDLAIPWRCHANKVWSQTTEQRSWSLLF